MRPAVIPPAAPSQPSFPLQPSAARAVAEYASRREARQADGARHTNRASDRRVAKLTREHTEAREAVVELEAENAALRATLERQRAELDRQRELQADLEESRHRNEQLEASLAGHVRREQDLRFQLREAEAERERLRTLLAGTMWYETKQA